MPFAASLSPLADSVTVPYSIPLGCKTQFGVSSAPASASWVCTASNSSPVWLPTFKSERTLGESALNSWASLLVSALLASTRIRYSALAPATPSEAGSRESRILPCQRASNVSKSARLSVMTISSFCTKSTWLPFWSLMVVTARAGPPLMPSSWLTKGLTLASTTTVEMGMFTGWLGVHAANDANRNSLPIQKTSLMNSSWKKQLRRTS